MVFSAAGDGAKRLTVVVRAAQLLALPIAKYLRELRITAAGAELAPIRDALAATSRPHLVALEVQRTGRDDYEPAPLDIGLVAPHLQRVTTRLRRAHRMFDDGPPHFLWIQVPGMPFTGPCLVERALTACEQAWPHLTNPERASWTMVWEFLRTLPRETRGRAEHRPFPAAVLAHALDSIALALPSEPDWAALRGALGSHPSRRITVNINRFLPPA